MKPFQLLKRRLKRFLQPKRRAMKNMLETKPLQVLKQESKMSSQRPFGNQARHGMVSRIGRDGREMTMKRFF
jgi:hypothetical protein